MFVGQLSVRKESVYSNLHDVDLFRGMRSRKTIAEIVESGSLRVALDEVEAVRLNKARYLTCQSGECGGSVQ